MKRYESVSWIYASNARRPACTEEKEWMRGERKKEVVCGWGGGPEGAGGRHSLVSVRYNSSTGIDTQLQQLLLDPSADTARSDPDDRGRRDSIVRTAREYNNKPLANIPQPLVWAFVFQFVRRSLRWSQKQLTLQHSYLRASAPIHNGPTLTPLQKRKQSQQLLFYFAHPVTDTHFRELATAATF
jgi:hypothetical protein